MVAPTGFYVVVLFVVYISFFAGGASPSPTDLYVAALSAQTARQIKI